MLKEVRFSHYKAFFNESKIELRPITMIIGKNSSGKSSILKLFPMLSNMLSGNLNYPLLLKNRNILMATTYEDLFTNRDTIGLEFGVKYDDGISIDAKYYMNGGLIGVYEIETRNGEDTYKRNVIESPIALNGMIDPEAMAALNISPRQTTFRVNYLGPLRVTAPHSVTFNGFANSLMNVDGDGVYNILLNSYLAKDGLFDTVSNWMKDNMEGQAIDFTNSINNSGSYGLRVNRRGVDVSVAAVGQGVAQVLPIIVQSYIAPKDSINVIEQPALHLHPAAHENVAYRLAESAKSNQCKYIVESHSENLLLGFRYMVANPDIDFAPEDIVIYFIKETAQGAKLKKIEVDANGDLSEWPTGVYGEAFDLLCKINKYRR